MRYAVNVQTSKTTDGWTSVTSSPTFYLDSNVQGITDLNHANHIVERWLTDAGLTVCGMTVIQQGDYYEADETICGDCGLCGAADHTASTHGPTRF